MSVRSVLRWILLSQMLVAGALLALDFGRLAPTTGFRFLPSIVPPADKPVRPGDQTRRFDPERMLQRPTSPGTPIPEAIDMPKRLFFDDEGDGRILVTGHIQPGDADRFAEWLSRAEPKPKTLLFHSPGGSVTDALDIGVAIRDAGLETEMQDGQICLSACPYMLMGGETRRVAESATVGVHQHYYGENTMLPAFLAVEDIQRSQADVVDHLAAMGIDLRVMALALRTPPAEIYVLVPEELEEYAITTTP